MERYGIIYKITNTKTNQCYIGATTEKRGFNGRYRRSGEGIERVYNCHKYNKDHKPDSFNKKLYDGMVEHGLENFSVDEEFDIAYSEQELHELEAKYIIEYDCINNGYNTKNEYTKDVFNNLPEEKQKEIKQKLREMNLGPKNPMYGRKNSEELRRHMSEKFSGKGNPMYGRKRDDVRGDKNPMCNPEIAKKVTGKNNGNSQRVLCITTNKEFDTVKEASEFYKCSSTHIGAVCKGKRKHCGKLEDGTKLSWKYID